MRFKTTVCLLVSLFLSLTLLGQETVERRSKLTPQVNEMYQVLKKDYNTLQGTYAAYFKKQLVAAGNFNNNVKTGTWTFFNTSGKLLQRYNYTTQTLLYEAPEDSLVGIRYTIDKAFRDTDRVTKPIRIGGRYYGYLRYTNLVKLPAELTNLDRSLNKVTMELLISPGGRLAEYKVRIKSLHYPDEVFTINLDLLKDEDKLFIPATLNYDPISSSIIIPCQLSGGDRISML